jgi:uncharacterized protein YeaO (DUF488 family)
VVSTESHVVNTPLKLRTFRIGTPAKRGDGLRIGTTRRPPRGVPKARWARDGYFDVWLPALAPSVKLLSRLRSRDLEDPAGWKWFFDSYERELLGNAESRQNVELVARIAQRIPISVGCFCADESRCHRSRLYEIILRYEL